MGDSLKLTHPFPRALSNLKLNWEANTSLPTLDRLKREKILLETSMLSSAKRACFLNKKWLSLFSLSQTCKQIIDSTISHSGHGTNHNFDNETPSHFAAYSLRSPMKRIIKHLRAHWGNSAQQIPGGKIIICFLSTESTRLKTAHLIMSLSSGRVRDASQSYLLDRKHRKKEKKKGKTPWICSLDGSCLVADVAGWWYMAFLAVWLCMFILSARSLDLFLSKPNHP